MDFHDYLRSKKIDPEIFKKLAEEQYCEWEIIFNRIHPESFTQQKLFLINQVRRKYHLKEISQEKKATAPKTIGSEIKILNPKTN
ncbi:MAG: hypothetical protein GDA51_03555 [Ekhidna sp.]|nr:hypothetical protein [Ekhidna sp.]MBC6409329.1 hypothetical protein [Ekhidna sp.]MBC6425543.1 hypothetical protein [Ekhidna sp.]